MSGQYITFTRCHCSQKYLQNVGSRGLARAGRSDGATYKAQLGAGPAATSTRQSRKSKKVVIGPDRQTGTEGLDFGGTRWLYRTCVELAEGTDEAPALAGARVLPLALPRAAILALLDSVAPPLLPACAHGGTLARNHWWELHARMASGTSPLVTWAELAAELDGLADLHPRNGAACGHKGLL
ncbi:unnamed protein product [Effrenium voratum]|uniref:Uncharacterized protein n=1 Tax=Effrenium voratum TaxID=2562239 RepID=A0AA36NLH4_9DINO|nr:unnamed protein product [Effrenium voratum]